MAGAAVALLVSSVAAGMAGACEAVLHEDVSRVRIAGPECSSWIQYDVTSRAYLGVAIDLGGGFLRQTLDDGEACSNGEVYEIIHDCNSGRVAVYGSDFTMSGEELDHDPKYTALNKVDSIVFERSHSGKQIGIDEILKVARDGGVEHVIEATTKGTVSVNGSKFPMRCGCKLFYPDSEGATQ